MLTGRSGIAKRWVLSLVSTSLPPPHLINPSTFLPPFINKIEGSLFLVKRAFGCRFRIIVLNRVSQVDLKQVSTCSCG